MDHRATQPLIEGSLERRSRAVIKGYSTGYYVVTPARYLHEFKDNDDFRRDPSPNSPSTCPTASSALSTASSSTSRVRTCQAAKSVTPSAQTLNSASRLIPPTTPRNGGPLSRMQPAARPGSSRSYDFPYGRFPGWLGSPSRSVSAQSQPPTYAEKEKQQEAQTGQTSGVTSTSPTAASPTTASASASPVDAKDNAASSAAPTPGINRTTSTASHFHGSPGGTAVQEKTEKS